MNETDAIEAFEALSAPRPSSTSAYSFTAIPFAPHNLHKLGKDEEGFPCLLISTGTEAKSNPRVPLVMENLAILFDLRCEVVSPGVPVQTGTFTVLKCVAEASAVRSYFISLLPVISAAIGQTTDQARIASVIEDLVELFRALGTPPKKEAQGLWSELLLIHESENPLPLAEAWHSDSRDLYDFNLATERMEVKATAQTPRQHHFTLEQLSPPPGTRLIVASIITKQSGAGLSLFELFDAVRQKISRWPQLQLRLARQVHEALGDSWQNVRNIRFDYEQAAGSIRYYDSNLIPRISLPLPIGVSKVRFVASLELLEPLSETAIAGSGSLFSNLPHRR